MLFCLHDCQHNLHCLQTVILCCMQGSTCAFTTESYASDLQLKCGVLNLVYELQQWSFTLASCLSGRACTQKLAQMGGLPLHCLCHVHQKHLDSTARHTQVVTGSIITTLKYVTLVTFATVLKLLQCCRLLTWTRNNTIKKMASCSQVMHQAHH